MLCAKAFGFASFPTNVQNVERLDVVPTRSLVKQPRVFYFYDIMRKTFCLLLGCAVSAVFVTGCVEAVSGHAANSRASGGISGGSYVDGAYYTLEEGYLMVQLPGRDSIGRVNTMDILLPDSLSMDAFERRFGPLPKGRRCRVHYQQRRIENDFGDYFSAAVMTRFEWL